MELYISSNLANFHFGNNLFINMPNRFEILHWAKRFYNDRNEIWVLRKLLRIVAVV